MCVRSSIPFFISGLSKISTETETTTTRRLAVFASCFIGELLSLLLTFPTGGRLTLICSAPGNILDYVYSTASIKYAYAAFLRDTGTVRLFHPFLQFDSYLSHPLILAPRPTPPRLLISLHLPPHSPSFLVTCYFRLLIY
jgi:hypothetical protein